MTTRWLTPIACAGLLLAQSASVDRAWDLLAKGNRPEAVRVLQQTITANPRDGEARLLLGSIFAEEGNGSEAIRQLREAVRLMPRSPAAHNALGEALSHAGDMNAARSAFKKALAVDPDFAQAHVNLGSALVESGDSGAAAGHLDRAIRILGKSADAAYPYYLRAKIYTENDKPGKAMDALQTSVSLQPDFAEAWSDLGQARKTMLDDEGAIAAFKRSVELSPDNAVSQYRLGAEYLRQGNAHDAVLHLRESFRLNPTNQSTLYSLQLALRQDGQVDEAAQVKKKLTEVLREIDRESENAFAALKLNNEGAALEKAGNLRGAVERYRQARALDPTHVGIHVNFGVALLRLGQWREGLAELREALRLDPANAKIQAALDDALKQAPAEFGGKGEQPNPASR